MADKNEVRARSTDADQPTLTRGCQRRTVPAMRIDVMVGDKHSMKGDRQALADVEMDVPKDSTVRKIDDIYITGTRVLMPAQNGDIVIQQMRIC